MATESPQVTAQQWRAAGLAADGRPSQALRAGGVWPFNDAEIAAVADAGYFEQAGRYVSNLLDVFAQPAEWDGPTADDPAVLGAPPSPGGSRFGPRLRGRRRR